MVKGIISAAFVAMLLGGAIQEVVYCEGATDVSLGTNFGACPEHAQDWSRELQAGGND